MKATCLSCCETCRFVFESVRRLERCPDCGSAALRRATEKEAAGYAADRRRYGPMAVYGIPCPRRAV